MTSLVDLLLLQPFGGDEIWVSDASYSTTKCSENICGVRSPHKPHRGRRTRYCGSGSISNHWQAALLQARRLFNVV